MRTWQILTIIVTFFFFFLIHGLVSFLFYFLFFFYQLGNDVQTKTTRLTFFDKSGTKVIKVFTPKSKSISNNKVFESFTTTESHIRFKFSLAKNAKHSLHGFKFVARPLRGLGIWLNERQVLHQHSLEWACWLVDLMLNSASKVLNQRVRDPNIINALQKYIQKKSSPYKIRVVVLLSRLLSDVNMYASYQQRFQHDDYDMGGGESKATSFVPPDLTLMKPMNVQTLQKAEEFREQDLPSALKPIVELACVSEMGQRALEKSEWAYGSKLPYSPEHLRTPLTPRINVCPCMDPWKSMKRHPAMMDIIIITQCIMTTPPLRLPDQLLVEIWRHSNNTSTSHKMSSKDMKKLEWLTRNNSKWTRTMVRVRGEGGKEKEKKNPISLLDTVGHCWTLLDTVGTVPFFDTYSLFLLYFYYIFIIFFFIFIYFLLFFRTKI